MEVLVETRHENAWPDWIIKRHNPLTPWTYSTHKVSYSGVGNLMVMPRNSRQRRKKSNDLNGKLLKFALERVQ